MYNLLMLCRPLCPTLTHPNGAGMISGEGEACTAQPAAPSPWGGPGVGLAGVTSVIYDNPSVSLIVLPIFQL